MSFRRVSMSLKIAAYTYPPWCIVYEEDGIKKIYGYVGAALTNITASMNLTIEIIPPLDGHYGDVAPNGTMVGSLMMIDKGYADVAAGPLDLVYFLWKEFPSTKQLFTDEMKIMSGMQDPFVSDSAAFINMFDKTSWILFITSLVVLILLSTFVFRVAGRKGKTSFFMDVSKYLYAYIEVLFFEATQVRFVPYANRVLLGAWLLACFVLVNLFNGEVKANLLVKSDTERINTGEDVLRHPELLPIASEKSPLTYVLQTSHLKDVQEVYKRMLERKGELPLSQMYSRRTLDAVIRRRAVMLLDLTSARYHASQHCSALRGYFYIGTQIITSLRSSWYFRRDVPRWIVDGVDKRSLWLNEMPTRFLRDDEVYPHGFACFLDSNKQDRSSAYQPLRFEDMRAVFLVTAFMLATSGVFLVIELCVFAFFYCARRLKCTPELERSPTSLSY